MPTPHDYYDHHSPEPHLHNRHNHAPYIEPDWQANAAKDQLPDISTIGRGPKGDGLYIDNIRQTGTSLTFDILSDATGEVIETIGPFPTGGLEISGTPVHNLIAGEAASFYVHYPVYDSDTGTVKTETTELTIPPGAMGSLIYLYPDILDRTKDDTYQINEEELTIYNRNKYPEKPAVRVNDILILETHKRIPAQDNQPAYDQYWLTFGTVEAVENGIVVFTARTFFDYGNVRVDWTDVLNKPTSVSYFDNDVDYQTKDEVDDAIANAISAAYRYKGIVETYEDLPDNAENGWVYHVNQAHEDVGAGTNWAWNEDEERWDALGGEVDFDGIATEAYVDAAIAAIPEPISSWDDITDKPEFADVATSGSYSDLEDKPNLAAVATTGSFYDLVDYPQDHLRRVYLSQAEYDALETKDPYTVYVTDGEGGSGDSGGIVGPIDYSDLLNAPLEKTVTPSEETEVCRCELSDRAIFDEKLWTLCNFIDEIDGSTAGSDFFNLVFAGSSNTDWRSPYFVNNPPSSFVINMAGANSFPCDNFSISGAGVVDYTNPVKSSSTSISEEAGDIELISVSSIDFVYTTETQSVTTWSGTDSNLAIWDDISDKPESFYTLPHASASTLGGIKVGEGLSVAADGTLSASGGSSSTGLQVAHLKYSNDETEGTLPFPTELANNNQLIAAADAGTRYDDVAVLKIPFTDITGFNSSTDTIINVTIEQTGGEDPWQFIYPVPLVPTWLVSDNQILVTLWSALSVSGGWVDALEANVYYLKGE